MKPRIRKQVFLAALLHDIGKFYQRAEDSISNKPNDKEYEQSKRLIGYICPENKEKGFGYLHSVWTHQFLVNIESTLKKIPDFMDNPFDNPEESIFKLASYHHKPSSELEALISLADWWSAGIDRRDNPKTEEKEEGAGGTSEINWGKDRYKKVPLYSVFNRILSGKYSNAYKLKALDLTQECFPHSVGNQSEGLNQEEYAKLWQKFNDEIPYLPTDTFAGFAESLLFLLKKYTWCIPSNTMDMANVSLFDHLKTTAAFADCLYCYKEAYPKDFCYNNTTHSLFLQDGKQPILLVGGDISGIQKFIYNITSSKAAVSLKGRSFYLQLLVDSLIQRIIDHPEIKASFAHVVYSSGGKFYMILPNTAQVKSALTALRKEFEEDIWQKHYGQLVLNMDYIPFAYQINDKQIAFGDAHNKTIGDLWQGLANKLSEDKNRKFHDMLTEQYDNLFEPQKCTEKVKVCAVTGIEADRDSLVLLNPQTLVLQSVYEQHQLGKVLKDADYILAYKGIGSSSYLDKKSVGNIEIAGLHNYLFDQKELIFDDSEFRKISSADVCGVKRINNTDFLATSSLKGKSCSYGFQFYGGNKQAHTHEGDNKTFEDLAGNSYLGILRMDVDNLGAIFINGLPNEDKSFSAYSTLSFMLDYFFSGYLNTIRNSEDFKNHVNILYSGGDDIFAIGQWDKLIEFAARVREDFRAFVGRSDITISGGIIMVKDKYPIAKAAELAGEAEDAAKKFKFAGEASPRKNALNLFGENISWDKEYSYVAEWKNNFVKHCKEPYNMPRSILHRIMTLSNVVRSNKSLEDGHKPDYSYIWHTSYYLTRFKERQKKNKEVYELCNKLEKELLDSRQYELISIAARWAELSLR